MPIISQSNNSANSLSIPAIEVERKLIKDAYFAIRKDEAVYEGEESTYTVVSGDTLGEIASEHNTTVAKIKADNGLSSTLITIGQELILSAATKKGDNISFEKINGAKVGDEVYILVETENAQDLDLKMNIKQGLEKGIVELDKELIVQQDEKNVAIIKSKVGNYFKDDENVLNKDDYKDWAIAKVILNPVDDDTTKKWNEDLDKLKDKKSKFYILVDGHSDNDFYITYHGRNPNDEGKPDHKTTPNYWLDIDGKWFEIEKACDCGKSLNLKFKCVKYGSQYGPVYFGTTKIDAYSGWNNLVTQNKVSSEEKEIIIAVTKNEGKLDSVQSYDSEIFSAGSVQKTVNSSGKGEFPKQVTKFKNDFPDKYKEFFEDCGWILDNNTLSYKDPSDSSSTKLTGSTLKTKIREGFDSTSYESKLKCKILEPIVKAMKDPDFQSLQVIDAKKRLNKVVKFKPSGYSYEIKSYLKSKLGKAVALDHHINRPAYVKPDLAEALDNFFATKDEEVDEYNKDKDKKDHKAKISRNPNEWGENHSDYETIILEDYGVNRRMSKRDGVSVAPGRYEHLKTEL
ncbi:LysM peptidoglycan-binding domain-containing protein [Aquimarina sp. MMG016]|uniref:LysM peptidoglycan-binding domain-containing protein n=1 Tax=Aquimarina sp. MMG016 TaxID=2822690 RepID=UPI001B39DA5E|nr:LysM peptidoglycan-binding domain-containing protein [Aquimarina sp. MMG016]MBQ4819638.1 LysM peptidoglycan-binding domain-containing protein [Aquimarina sp. MMG016]